MAELALAKVTRKGQMAIPQELRDALEKTLLQRNSSNHLEILKSAAPGGCV